MNDNRAGVFEILDSLIQAAYESGYYSNGPGLADDVDKKQRIAEALARRDLLRRDITERINRYRFILADMSRIGDNAADVLG